MRLKHAFLICCGLVLTGYSLFWLYAANRLESEIAAFFDQLEHKGFHIAAAEPGLSGFPFDINLQFDGLEITNPKDQWQWIGQDLTVNATPWQLNRLHIHPNGTQQISILTPDERIRLTLQASDSKITLGRDEEKGDFASITAKGLEVSDQDHRYNFGFSQLAVTGSMQDPRDRDLHLNGLKMSLSASGIRLPNQNQLPLGSMIAALDFDISMPSGVPLNTDEEALDAWQQVGGTLEIEKFMIQWGQFGGHISGALTLDDSHRPDGILEAELANLPQTLLGFADKGLLDKKQAGIAAAAIQFFSVKQNRQGQPVISLPIHLTKGGVMLGPVRLAVMPSFSGRQLAARKMPRAPIPDGLPTSDQLSQPPTVTFPTDDFGRDN